jgi:hypothetical protein
MRLQRVHRAGYTFLEVILALGLSLILVAGIYSAVQMTYQQWEVGRQAAEEAQVVRALFQRIRTDLHATITTWTPPAAPQAASSSTSGAATGAAGSTTGGSATGGSTGASTGSTSGTPSSTTPSAGDAAAQNPTEFPPGGVMGAGNSISVVARLAPSDLDFSQNLPVGTTASVMKTITYRIGALQDSESIDDGVEGLIRDESPGTPDATSPDGHSPQTRSDLLAPEVRQLRISYYDGLFWSDTWDLLQSGPPVCVQIEVGMKLSTLQNVDSDGLRWYRALITFPPAASASSESGESSESSGSSTPSGSSSGAGGGNSSSGSGSNSSSGNNSSGNAGGAGS